MQTLVKTIVSTAAVLAFLALPATAGAEYLIPPGNSAANQYTEALPSGGGDRNADRGKRKPPPPDRALGKANARRLRSEGVDGKAAAELAAATAPGATAAPGDTDGGDGDGRQANDPSGQEGVGGGGSSADSGGGAAGGLRGVHPGGSSAFGEAVSQATGLGATGPVPLLILATVLWAVLYLARQRRSSAAA